MKNQLKNLIRSEEFQYLIEYLDDLLSNEITKLVNADENSLQIQQGKCQLLQKLLRDFKDLRKKV